MDNVKLNIKSIGPMVWASYLDDKCSMEFRQTDEISEFEFSGKMSSRRNMRVMIKQIAEQLSKGK